MEEARAMYRAVSTPLKEPPTTTTCLPGMTAPVRMSSAVAAFSKGMGLAAPPTATTTRRNPAA